MADVNSGLSGLAIPPAGELVFDDEPLDATVYGQPGPGPTPASLFKASRRVLDRIAGGNSQEDILLAAADVAMSGQSISADDYTALAPLFKQLARFRRELFAPHSDTTLLLSRLLDLARAHRDSVLLTNAGVPLALQCQFSGMQKDAAMLWQELGEAQRLANDGEDQFFGFLEDCTWSSWPALCADSRCQGTAFMLQHLQSFTPDRPTPIPATEVSSGFVSSPASWRPDSYLTMVQPALERLASTHTGISRASLERRCVAVATLEITAGPVHPFTASCLNMLIRSLQIAEEHQAARMLAQIAVEIRTRVLASTHPLLSTSYNNLGLSLVCLGEYDEAERVLGRAVDLLPNNAYPLYWLGRLYQQRGRLGDMALEARAWRRYLELKGTTAERIREAQARLEQLPVF